MAKICLIIFLITFANPIFAENDFQLFHDIFSKWTQNFNDKKLEGTCSLFSKAVISNYRGLPQRNYNTICNGFKKIFSDNIHTYHYDFKIHQIYRSGNLAAVRITWFLSSYKMNTLELKIRDEGLDVFVKNKKGQWQIINYLGYPVN